MTTKMQHSFYVPEWDIEDHQQLIHERLDWWLSEHV